MKSNVIMDDGVGESDTKAPKKGWSSSLNPDVTEKAALASLDSKSRTMERE